jgi:hypothetical protein
LRTTLSRRKVKDWSRDKKWLQEPADGVISPDRLEMLKDWLIRVDNPDLDDLKQLINWDNNKPAGIYFFGLNIRILNAFSQ